MISSVFFGPPVGLAALALPAAAVSQPVGNLSITVAMSHSKVTVKKIIGVLIKISSCLYCSTDFDSGKEIYQYFTICYLSHRVRCLVMFDSKMTSLQYVLFFLIIFQILPLRFFIT
jgi:hypothetical protein